MHPSAQYSTAGRVVLSIIVLVGSIALILLMALARILPNAWLRYGGLAFAVGLGGYAVANLFGYASSKDTAHLALYIWLVGTVVAFILVVVGTIQFFIARGSQ